MTGERLHRERTNESIQKNEGGAELDELKVVDCLLVGLVSAPVRNSRSARPHCASTSVGTLGPLARRSDVHADADSGVAAS